MNMSREAAVTALRSTLDLVAMWADDAHERACRDEGTHSEVQTAIETRYKIEDALDLASPCTCGGRS